MRIYYFFTATFEDGMAIRSNMAYLEHELYEAWTPWPWSPTYSYSFFLRGTCIPNLNFLRLT